MKLASEDETGVSTWQINADEPRSMDYIQAISRTDLSSAGACRSSDNDTGLIGTRKEPRPTVAHNRGTYEGSCSAKSQKQPSSGHRPCVAWETMAVPITDAIFDPWVT